MSYWTKTEEGWFYRPPQPRAAHPRNKRRSNINERNNEPRPKAAHPRNRPVLRQPKAAHHLNHPMFIPNRDEDSDEEVGSKGSFFSADKRAD